MGTRVRLIKMHKYFTLCINIQKDKNEQEVMLARFFDGYRWIFMIYLKFTCCFLLLDNLP